MHENCCLRKQHFIANGASELLLSSILFPFMDTNEFAIFFALSYMLFEALFTETLFTIFATYCHGESFFKATARKGSFVGITKQAGLERERLKRKEKAL